MPGTSVVPGIHAVPNTSGFHGGSDGKESTCDEEDSGDPGSIPWWGQSLGGGPGNPLQYSCLENLHGHRSLVGYGPWDYRVGHECATEHTHTNTHTHT